MQRVLSGANSFLDSFQPQTISPPAISHRPIKFREKLSVNDDEGNSVYSHLIVKKAKAFAHKMSVDRKRRESRLKNRFEEYSNCISTI